MRATSPPAREDEAWQIVDTRTTTSAGARDRPRGEGRSAPPARLRSTSARAIRPLPSSNGWRQSSSTTIKPGPSQYRSQRHWCWCVTKGEGYSLTCCKAIAGILTSILVADEHPLAMRTFMSPWAVGIEHFARAGSVPIVRCSTDSTQLSVSIYRMTLQLCKKRSSCATKAHICEVTHKDDDLLDHPTEPSRAPAATPLRTRQLPHGAIGLL